MSSCLMSRNHYSISLIWFFSCLRRESKSNPCYFIMAVNRGSQTLFSDPYETLPSAAHTRSSPESLHPQPLHWRLNSTSCSNGNLNLPGQYCSSLKQWILSHSSRTSDSGSIGVLLELHAQPQTMLLPSSASPPAPLRHKYQVIWPSMHLCYRHLPSP